ncbi:hypothetical protein QZH41_010715, partial [Actinostola sp. cb2023]
KTNIKINDMTSIQPAEPKHYDFQFQVDPKEKLMTLKDIDKDVQPMQLVGHIQGKIRKTKPAEIVGNDKKFKLMKAAINDNSNTMIILLWEDNIDKITSGTPYKLSNIRVKIQDGQKVLSTTTDTTIEVANNTTLQDLSDESGTKLLDDLAETSTIVSCSGINFVENTDSGDPLQYPVWSSAFKALVDARDWDADTKLNLLNQYVSGGPKQVVEHYLLIGTEDAYVKAKSVLRERYGNPNVVSSAFLSKLDKWPKIAPRDSGGLREFSDFLDKVVAAREHIPSLAILDFAKENVKLLAKLPYHIESKWRDVITTWRVKNGESSYPSFLKFTDFIRAAADKANIPELEDLSKLTSKPKMVRSPGAQAFATSVSADRQYYKRESTDQVDRRSERSSKREQTDQVIKSEKSHKKESAGRVDQTSCFYCDKDHQLEDCEGFKEKPYSERKNFFFKKKTVFRLCFDQPTSSERLQKQNSM